ncbi:hypothetical protein M422DRAFT_263498 [Sphaerobolus stellatus SS14]|uniref:Uncharacterized protein n=1 Tax=Sphaerobolus stellatus (strain SS14) TaxID=990650 RepID=A0A0C9UHP1_SPHS4|nr:hypothetical protein M422DRAFT_263498 [Sphaerobolus stellatus SS14]
MAWKIPGFGSLKVFSKQIPDIFQGLENSAVHILMPSRFRPEQWFNLTPTYDPKFSFLDFSAGNYSCLAWPMAICGKDL